MHLPIIEWKGQLRAGNISTGLAGPAKSPLRQSAMTGSLHIACVVAKEGVY